MRSPRSPRACAHTVLGLVCLIGVLAVPSFARAASAPKCMLVVGSNTHVGRCGATFLGSGNVRIQIATSGIITRTPALATVQVRPNFNNVLAAFDPRARRFVYVADGIMAGNTTYALLSPADLPQFKRETLRLMTAATVVFGGRIACSSRLLVHYTPTRGCQDVLITTAPWSKVLMTIRYGTRSHYIEHKRGYADARGIYQLLFPVDYNPSARERSGSIGVVDVTVALGHAVKNGYTIFRVLPT